MKDGVKQDLHKQDGTSPEGEAAMSDGNRHQDIPEAKQLLDEILGRDPEDEAIVRETLHELAPQPGDSQLNAPAPRQARASTSLSDLLAQGTSAAVYVSSPKTEEKEPPLPCSGLINVGAMNARATASGPPPQEVQSALTATLTGEYNALERPAPEQPPEDDMPSGPNRRLARDGSLAEPEETAEGVLMDAIAHLEEDEGYLALCERYQHAEYAAQQAAIGHAGAEELENRLVIEFAELSHRAAIGQEMDVSAADFRDDVVFARFSALASDAELRSLSHKANALRATIELTQLEQAARMASSDAVVQNLVERQVSLRESVLAEKDLTEQWSRRHESLEKKRAGIRDSLEALRIMAENASLIDLLPDEEEALRMQEAARANSEAEVSLDTYQEQTVRGLIEEARKELAVDDDYGTLHDILKESRQEEASVAESVAHARTNEHDLLQEFSRLTEESDGKTSETEAVSHELLRAMAHRAMVEAEAERLEAQRISTERQIQIREITVALTNCTDQRLRTFLLEFQMVVGSRLDVDEKRLDRAIARSDLALRSAAMLSQAIETLSFDEDGLESIDLGDPMDGLGDLDNLDGVAVEINLDEPEAVEAPRRGEDREFLDPVESGVSATGPRSEPDMPEQSIMIDPDIGAETTEATMPPPRDPNPVWPPLRFAPQDRPDDFETKAIEPEAVDAARTDLYEIDPDADDPLSPEALANRQKGHDGDTGVIEVVSSDEPLYNSDDEKDPFYKLAPGSDHPDAQGDRTRLTWSQRMDMGIQAIERGLNRIDDAVPEWVLGPGVAAVVLIFIIAGLMIFLISIKNEEDPKIMAVAMEERTGEAEARARELSTIVMGQATQVAERVDAIEEPEGEPESIVVASKEEPSPTIITTSDPPKDAESVVGEPAEDPAEEPSGPEATEPDPVVEPEPPAVVMTEGPPNEFLEESEPAVEETADEEPEEEPDEDSAAMAASADAGKEAAEELKPASEPEPELTVVMTEGPPEKFLEEPEPVAEPEPAVVQKPEPKKTKPEPDEPTIVASREEPEQVQEEPRKTTPQVHFVIRGGKVVRTSPEARPVVSYVVRGGKVVRQ